METYLLKYLDSEGIIIHKPVDPLKDIFRLAGIQLGGNFTFNQQNIVTVSGVNSLTTALDSVSSQTHSDLSAVSGYLQNEIISVSSSLSAVSGFLQNEIVTVSGQITSNLGAVSGFLHNEISTVSGQITANVAAVSGFLQNEIVAVSGKLHNEILIVSGSLQLDIDAITSDIAQEQVFIANSGQTNFTVSGFIWNPSELIRDLQVFQNGQRRVQSLDGSVSGGDYVKLSTSTLQFINNVTMGDSIIIREERTGGGSGGGSTNLQAINVSPAPLVNGYYDLGTISNAWNSLFLKDQMTSHVYQIEIVNGILQAVQVS